MSDLSATSKILLALALWISGAALMVAGAHPAIWIGALLAAVPPYWSSSKDANRALERLGAARAYADMHVRLRYRHPWCDTCLRTHEIACVVILDADLDAVHVSGHSTENCPRLRATRPEETP